MFSTIFGSFFHWNGIWLVELFSCPYILLHDDRNWKILDEPSSIHKKNISFKWHNFFKWSIHKGHIFARHKLGNYFCMKIKRCKRCVCYSYQLTSTTFWLCKDFSKKWQYSFNISQCSPSFILLYHLNNLYSLILWLLHYTLIWV